MQCNGYTIGRLYCLAFGGKVRDEVAGIADRISFTSRLIVESRDIHKIELPGHYQDGISSDSNLSWFAQNAYNYLLVLPPNEKDSLRIFRTMQL